MRKQLDEFGDVSDLRRRARARASRLGHKLGKFKVRPNDNTKADAYCASCGQLAVVNAEPDKDLPPTYGHVFQGRCRSSA